MYIKKNAHTHTHTQRHVKNQRSIPRINKGTEEVGNLNSSIRGEGRSLNALHRSKVNLFACSLLYVHWTYYVYWLFLCPRGF